MLLSFLFFLGKLLKIESNKFILIEKTVCTSRCIRNQAKTLPNNCNQTVGSSSPPRPPINTDYWYDCEVGNRALFVVDDESEIGKDDETVEEEDVMESDFQKGIVFWPNPVKGQVNVKYAMPTKGNIHISLIPITNFGGETMTIKQLFTKVWSFMNITIKRTLAKAAASL